MKKFKEQCIQGVKTPILLPENFKAEDIKDGKIGYFDETREKRYDEPLFVHGEDKVFLNQFRSFFSNDSVIVLLFSPSNNLFLHRRSSRKKWAPGKIDLASIAGQRRAIFAEGHFDNEKIENTALREVSEETGVPLESLSQNSLCKLGTHINPHTKEYQTIFAYRLNATLEELNENLKTSSFDEVEQWFEQGYEQTMKEYFGNMVEKYAGGAEMRHVNFISDKKIRKALDDLFQGYIRWGKYPLLKKI
ncbi:MAG: NUDIX hydrolase [Nanoarchaeota archaeon]